MAALADMLYPRACIGCGISAPDIFAHVCWECWADVVRIEPPFCALCGDPVAGSIEHEFTCFSCTDHSPAFEAARSVVRYDGVAGTALRMFKYERALWLAPDLAVWMEYCIRAEYSRFTFDFIVPVPLHAVRRRERGYNQAALLARALGRRIKCPVRPSVVRRIRKTATQTHLTAKQRISNVHAAFDFRKEGKLAGRRILLVDDVMTTGATVNACATALKKGGAASVHVITVARG